MPLLELQIAEGLFIGVKTVSDVLTVRQSKGLAV